jgi:anti-anti-sigma factor
MNAMADMFEVERAGATAVVTPQAELGELACCAIEVAGREVLRLLEDSCLRNVVLDLGRMDYCGSSALGLFAALWQKVRRRNGRMVLCNVSAHEQDILEVVGLAGLWPVYPSRKEAVEAVGR